MSVSVCLCRREPQRISVIAATTFMTAITVTHHRHHRHHRHHCHQRRRWSFQCYHQEQRHCRRRLLSCGHTIVATNHPLCVCLWRRCFVMNSYTPIHHCTHMPTNTPLYSHAPRRGYYAATTGRYSSSPRPALSSASQSSHGAMCRTLGLRSTERRDAVGLKVPCVLRAPPVLCACSMYSRVRVWYGVVHL